MAQIKCVNCGKTYEVSEDVNGKKVKCTSCESIFVAEIEKEEIILVESEVKKVEKEDDLNIKPHKLSYFLLGNPQIILFGILSLFGAFISSLVFGLFIFLFLVSLYWVKVKYEKESYTLTDRKIIYSFGNLFSDNSVEVNLDKVTQVRSVLGFVQYNIFKTGNLFVKTAGSSNSKINLKNFLNTMEVYENIQKRMQKNGFHLQKDKLVQTAKPHWLGVVGEVFGKILLSFVLVVYIIGGFVGAISELGFGFLSFLFISPFILFLIISITILIVKYLDLKRRKYEIFTDSIFYTEGFLTKEYSFLPMESVSDTENTQSFFSKIFGLHDVIVSSEGSNNKVMFKNMTEGEQMMKNIRYLKDNIIMGEKDIIDGEEKSVNSIVGFKDKIEKPLNYNKEFKGEYKMSFLKTLFFPIVFGVLFLVFGLIFFPSDLKSEVIGIIPFLIAISIGLIIKVLFTKYRVGESSIESKFEFLSKKENIFSVEKITGVYFRESLIDKLLGTISIYFWSIGSNSSLKFINIKKEENLEKNILSKLGINKEEEKEEIDVNFNLLDYLKSNIGLSIIIFVISLILLVIGFSIPEIPSYIFVIFILLFLFIFGLYFFYNKIFFSKKFYKQNLYNDFIESISGIIIIKKYYSLFRNVKGLKTKKYPLTQTGNFRFDISGEQIVQSKNKKGISIVSNSIDLKYVKNLFEFHENMEEKILGEKLDREVVKTSKQDIGNTILGIILVYIIALFVVILGANADGVNLFFPVLIITIIFAIIIGLIVWTIKVKYYNFEGDRVLFGSGIIYKRRQSILYDKFNFVEKNRGFINKLFKNGNVSIYTLGSGKVEMKISDIDNYEEIYNLLKKD